MRRRILLVLANLAGGGAERMALLLLRGLADEGHGVTLFLFKREGVYFRELDPRIRLVTALPEKFNTRAHAMTVLHALVREACRHDVVIGGLEGWPTVLASVAASVSRKPCVGWVHTDLLAYPNFHSKPAMSFLLRAIYRRLAKIVFVSEGARRSASHWIGRTVLDNSIVIHNAAAQAAPAPGKKCHPFTEPRLDVNVLAVGRLTASKGFDTLLEAHALVRSEGYRCRLTIVGEGEERSTLQRLARDLRFEDSVSMPGFSTDIERWYQRGDIFVLSSRFEGFGLVLVEAMGHGLPVIATDCPSGPAEILENGRYGVLVPVDNPRALAKEIAVLASDAGRRMQLGVRATERSRHYSPARFARQWSHHLSTL